MAAPDISKSLRSDALAALSASTETGPVVMLNLLRFKPDGGAEKYAEYGAAAAPHLAKVGGKVIFAGRPGELLIGHETWDLMLLVRYPSRKHFLSLMSDPEYLAVTPLREAAIVDSVLYATDQVRFG